MLLSQYSSSELVNVACFQSLQPMFNSAFLSDPFGISANNKRQRNRHKTAQAPSKFSAHAVALRETLQRGMAMAEALRRSARSCLSHSVTTMSQMRRFGNGL